MESDEEVWRPVPSISDVEASSWGRVRRTITLYRNAPRPTYGVRNYTRNRAGEKIYCTRVVAWTGIGSRSVPRLVAEAFHGPAPFPKAQVLHLDDDTDNNRPENLRWGTHRENLNSGRFRDLCRARTIQRDASGRIVSMTPALSSQG